MDNTRVLTGESRWIAFAKIQEDGSVLADIVDNNGTHRDYNKKFDSLTALQEYLDSQ